jgi:hypothetical protein
VLELPDGSAALSLSLQSTVASATAPVSQLRALLPLHGWVGKSISCAKFSRPPPAGSSLEVHAGGQAVVLSLPVPTATLYKISIHVEFGGGSQAYPAVDIPFIDGAATCALIQFAANRLISGIMLDSKKIICHPSMSLECVVDMSSISSRNSTGMSEFWVWNKYGPSPD